MRYLATVLGVVLAAAPEAAAQEYDYVEEEEESGEYDVLIALDAEFFAGGAYTRTDEEKLAEFEVDRGEVGIRLDYGDVVSAELRLETTRLTSSDPGPEDDGLTVRAKRAWLSWQEKPKRRERPRFQLRGGLIPDPWIEAIEGGYELRGLAPTAAEHADLIDHSDLGLGVVATWKMVRAQVAVTNGEGRARPERNREKNTSAILTVRMPRLPNDLVVAAHVYGRGGSEGIAGVKSHRLGTAMVFDSPRYGGGGELVNAWGVDGHEDVTAVSGAIWAYATVKGRTGVAGRLDWISTVDESDVEGHQQTTTLALWHDLIPRGDSRVRDFGVRGYLAAQFERVGMTPPAMAGAPPVDAARVMVILQASARETVE